MATNESPLFDEHSGTPQIPPSTLRAWSQLPHDTDEQYIDLRRDNPDLTQAIFIASDRYGDGDIDKKRAFAAGAFFVCGLLKFDTQVEGLRTIMDESPNGDGGGAVNQQPSGE